jgi:hypothetical protein
MGLSSHDQTARQFVFDSVDVSDLKWSPLDVIVEKLTNLQAEGYTDLEVEAYDDYGSATTTLKVTKQRLENDEEYAGRMKFVKAREKREYDHFLQLKAKFEDPTKPF